MQPIHPITVENCRNLIGKTVFLYLNNGLDFIGTVSSVEKNKLIFNDNQQAKLNSTTKSTKSLSPKKGKRKPLQPDPTLQVTPAQQLSSFGLPLFGGLASSTAAGPDSDLAARAPGPVDIHMDLIAAMFTI